MPRATRRSSPRTFQLFGFPTAIRPGFGIFLVLLAVLYPFPLGLLVAGAVALFTVVHELGHAFAARRYKCDASIALDFMVAYASYSTSVPLTWRQKIFISLAGPSFQVGSAALALVAFGINPLSRTDIASSETAAAVWWAGIALGLVNLIPLLPLDGGAVVGEVAERFFPQRGRHAVLQASFGVTAVLGALCFFFGLTGLLPLFVFMLVLQWQQLSLPRRLKRAFDQAQLVSHGDPDVDEMVISALLEVGEAEQALAYASHAYTQCPSFSNAFGAARACWVVSRKDDAVSWLRAAHASQLHPDELRLAMLRTEEFVELRDQLDVESEWFTK
jgi:Zn-dependent protease